MESPNTYHFKGTHYIASYMGCDNAKLMDIEGLKKHMIEAVVASGASVKSMTDHIFDSGGYTAIFLLSESHASIHTYPENNSCFVDLFTCGTKCSYVPFKDALVDYLEPQSIESQVIDRGDTHTQSVVDEVKRFNPESPNIVNQLMNTCVNAVT